MAERRKYTEQEILDRIKEEENFIINGNTCNFKHYHHFKNNFTLMFNSHKSTYFTNSETYGRMYDSIKMVNIKNYLSNNEIIEISQPPNKKGYYKLTDFDGKDGFVEFHSGNDVLDIKSILKSHQNYIECTLDEYKKIDLSNYIELTEQNSERGHHFLENNTNNQYKEFKILDEKYFNYLITLKNNFGIVREMVGTTPCTIYTKCKIHSYDVNNRTILFEFLTSLLSLNRLNIHIDMNINPFKDLKKIKRKNKICKLTK